jgi:hypothetical protein
MSDDHPTDGDGQGLYPLTHSVRSIGSLLRTVDATRFPDSVNAIENPAFDELRGRIRRRLGKAGENVPDLAQQSKSTARSARTCLHVMP